MHEPEIAADPDATAPGQGAGAVTRDGDRLLIRLLLELTPEQRLRGLANAAEFFALARRV